MQSCRGGNAKENTKESVRGCGKSERARDVQVVKREEGSGTNENAKKKN